MAETNNAEWLELCAAAAREADSQKLASLVERIIEALDRNSARPPVPQALDK